MAAAWVASSYCWGDHADLAVEASVVKPVDVFEGGDLDVVDRAPGAAAVDQFGLVETDCRLGEGVVVGVAAASDAALEAGLVEALGVADREVLDAVV